MRERLPGIVRAGCFALRASFVTALQPVLPILSLSNVYGLLEVSQRQREIAGYNGHTGTILNDLEHYKSKHGSIFFPLSLAAQSKAENKHLAKGFWLSPDFLILVYNLLISAHNAARCILMSYVVGLELI